MITHIVNPLSDHRWDELVDSHPKATAFHRSGWLKALALTYGYEPFALTTSPTGAALENGIVACRVSSWITGTRLVSLPFSDHCEPLLENVQEFPEFVSRLRADCDRQRWRYIELRPLPETQFARHDLQPCSSYWFHELDLRPGLEKLFRGMHKDGFQRKVRKAEREGLSCERGRSTHLVDEFYKLLVITRKRHQLPPQPRAWFQNLVECMGEKIQIMVARKNGAPVAAMLTLRHRSSLIYKYGCSDERFHNLGGVPFLFWRLIEEGKSSGAEMIDLGRSDLQDEGLTTFKDRLGATKRMLTYYRYSRTARQGAASLHDSRTVRQLFSLLPDAMASVAGRALYRHMG